MAVQAARPGVTPAPLPTHSSNLAQGQPIHTPTMTARLSGLRQERSSAVLEPAAVVPEEKAVRLAGIQNQLAIPLANKRSVEEELDEVFKRAEDMPAMSPSLMPRRHKRSAHRHAVVRGLKALI